MIAEPGCMCASAALQVWNSAKMFVRKVCSSSSVEMSSSPSCAIW